MKEKCPACRGHKNIYRGICKLCGGKGKVVFSGREQECLKCDGKGKIYEQCHLCSGYGWVKSKKESKNSYAIRRKR